MMTSSSAHAASENRCVRLLGATGLGLLRYGLVFLLVMSGSLKFLAFAAEGIEPLVSNSPLLAWLYPLIGLRGTSGLIGVVEVGVGAFSPTQSQALAEGAYIERAEPVVFIGECGTGSTHLPTGLCVAASRHGGDQS
ncbi:MAG: DUF417 family protein [Candidatus Entotheonellia bacterium]